MPPNRPFLPRFFAPALPERNPFMCLTDRAAIRALCQKHGFHLSKNLGQHFLVNPGICPKLCAAAGIGPGSQVLEIGPGFGTLTRQLAQRAKKVVALEVDSRLLPVLRETLNDLPNATVVRGDALKENLHALVAAHFSGPVTVCANLPYNITSPLLMRLLEDAPPLESITVMVQKEAAERFTAAPGTRAAGAVTYAVHYYAAAAPRFLVEPGSFMPPPKVKSAVITLTPRRAPALAACPQRQKNLFRLIRAAFAQRRKTLVNAVAAGLSIQKPVLRQALAAIGAGALTRPEQLTLEQYIALQFALWPETG
jgi:16S rRNA (adenine1518-N6/adenine1519-N6)-dimethyltransferase